METKADDILPSPGLGTLVSAKVVKSRISSTGEGYGFLEFLSHEAAANFLKTYNGSTIPGIPEEKSFRLNWAGLAPGKNEGDNTDHSIFVGDLTPDVTDFTLQENFQRYFPSVRCAKVITDVVSNRSKGYGFVRFGDEEERNRSIEEMQGHHISGRPIRVSIATAKKAAPHDTRPVQITSGQVDDLNNTTLFIGALSSTVTEEDLKSFFGKFGPVVYCKIPAGGGAPKGCAFVQFVSRSAAEHAMHQMHGKVIGSSAIRISWGRNSSKPFAQPSSASNPPSYPGGMYAHPAPNFPHPAFQNPAMDPYAAYMGQPVTDAHVMQAYRPKQKMEMQLEIVRQARGSGNSALEILPAFSEPDQDDIARLNADYMRSNQISLLGNIHDISDIRRAGLQQP